MGTLVAAGALVASVWHGEPSQPIYQGWVEANFVFIGADEVGRVGTLFVREGDTVTAKAPLFTVNDDLERAAVAQEEAALANAQQTFHRAQELVKTGSGTRKEYDAAQSALSETEARLDSARTRLNRRKVYAPADGTIHEVYYRPGEVVPAGRPVVSLLPPGNIKVRFFVPEGRLPEIKNGDEIKIACDGCAPNLMARVSFVSREAEYTPPVIYSLEERSKLVFLIEAWPDHPELVRVGQPVRVVLANRQSAP
ncbi:MAG: efflux RND transporter periplasmic adaptor subunit [Xanthobacteraceae bacterium]